MPPPESAENETDWGSIWRNVGLLVFILIAVGGYAFWKSQQKGGKSQDEVAESGPTRYTRSSGSSKKQPSSASAERLSVADSVATTDSVRHHATTWLEHAWQAEGLQDPVPPHLTKEQWLPFVKAAILFKTGAPDATSQQNLRKQALALVPVAGEHPVSAYVVAQALGTHEAASQLFEKAYAGLKEKPGMETLAFHAIAKLTMSTWEQESERFNKERMADGLGALRKALDAEDGYSKPHDLLCSFLLHEQAPTFFEASHEGFSQEVSKTTGAKPWVKKWIEGMHCLQKAWDARGGGYAYTVSNNAGNVFANESENARRLLQEAWSLKPENPAPAVLMIYSWLSVGDEAPKLMRHWFNEVLTVQADVPKASHNVLWGLRPRWYGSLPEMGDFGLDCMGTGRFDTGLPWVLLEAHRDCSSEWSSPDDYFKALPCYHYLKELFDGAEAEPKRAAWRSLDRTHSAIVAFKCRKYKDAQAWLEKLEFKPDPRALESWGMNPELLVVKTEAYAGEAGRTLLGAESAENNFNATTAVGLYRKVLESESSKLTKAGLKYVERQVAILDAEDRLQRGETVSWMPDNQFRVWTRKGGGWRPEDGALEHQGSGKYHITSSEARVGPIFTVSGEIELINATEPGQVWIAYGNQEHSNYGRWIALRFAFDGKQTVAILSNGLDEPVERAVLDVGPRFKFSFTSNKENLSLSVDEKVAFAKVPVPDNFVKKQSGLIGLGAFTKGAQTKIKIHQLNVKSE